MLTYLSKIEVMKNRNTNTRATIALAVPQGPENAFETADAMVIYYSQGTPVVFQISSTPPVTGQEKYNQSHADM